jgi:hypothetical protein
MAVFHLAMRPDGFDVALHLGVALRLFLHNEKRFAGIYSNECKILVRVLVRETMVMAVTRSYDVA